MLDRARRYGDKLREEGLGAIRESLAYRLAPTGPPEEPLSPLPGVFEWLSRRPFAIVQIGAYIGDSFNDPLYAFLRENTSGVAVLAEPVRDYYDRLVSAYDGQPHVHCENVAIAETAGEREIHRL